MTLSQWSVLVQLSTASLLAVLFFALASSLRLVELQSWKRAWLANTVALAAIYVTAFWAAEGAPGTVALAAYLAGKTAFVLLVIAGVGQHLVPGAKAFLAERRGWWVVAAWGIGVGVASSSIVAAHMAQSSMVAGTFVPAAFWVWRHPRFPRSRWLAGALALEGALFTTYAVALAPHVWGNAAPGGLLRVTSFFDAGAELILAVSMLIALESSSTAQLRHLHAELMDSYDRLRALVDHDPLTGMANRRALETEPLRQHPVPVAVVFVDVDNFKDVNDRYGHMVGDACLVRVARVIATRFRPEDRIFRWGGDEFLVLASGMSLEGVEERFADTCRDLEKSEDGLPACRLTMGASQLLPNQRLEDALAAADAAMYRAREARRQASH
ncbi:MAG: diguanylate cyclase domain-containing protein [Thermoanaerobaculum sp.]